VAKRSLSPLNAVLAASLILGVSVGQVEKQAASHGPDRSDECPIGDILGGLLTSITKGVIRDFEMEDSMERALFFQFLGNPKATDKALDNGDVVSMVIFRRGDSEFISRVYEHWFDESWVLRFRRVITPSVRAPVAIITTASFANGRPTLSETVFRPDEKGRWIKWSNTERKDNPAKSSRGEPGLKQKSGRD